MSRQVPSIIDLVFLAVLVVITVGLPLNAACGIHAGGASMAAAVGWWFFFTTLCITFSIPLAKLLLVGAGKGQSPSTSGGSRSRNHERIPARKHRLSVTGGRMKQRKNKGIKLYDDKRSSRSRAMSTIISTMMFPR